MVDTRDPLQSPDCMKEETKLLSGQCPHCKEVLEFFSMPELRNQKTCYNCKKPFDAKKFAQDLGMSI